MRKLLVIDDEKSVRDTLQILLTHFGYEITVAENGPRGIELFGTAPFDGAVVDLHMPAMNGLEVCRVLREKAGGAIRDFPVWIITGARTREAADSAAQVGARTMLSKPFAWDEFRAMLDREFASHD